MPHDFGLGKEYKKETTSNSNEVWLHKENGIIQLRINGTDVLNVSDFKIVSPAFGDTELTFTIKAEPFITDAEIGLKDMRK